MGVSIDIHKYKVADLCNDLESQVKAAGIDLRDRIKPREFLATYMPYFGEVSDGNFYVLWNEYYEDYNAAHEFMIFVGTYYGIDDLFLGGYHYPVPAANAAEVWEEVFDTKMPDTDD